MTSPHDHNSLTDQVKWRSNKMVRLIETPIENMCKSDGEIEPRVT